MKAHSAREHSRAALAIARARMMPNGTQRKATRGDAVPHCFVTKIPMQSTSHAQSRDARVECGASGVNANHEGLVLCRHAAVSCPLERLDAPSWLFECVLLPAAFGHWRCAVFSSDDLMPAWTPNRTGSSRRFSEQRVNALRATRTRMCMKDARSQGRRSALVTVGGGVWLALAGVAALAACGTANSIGAGTVASAGSNSAAGSGGNAVANGDAAGSDSGGSSVGGASAGTGGAGFAGASASPGGGQGGASSAGAAGSAGAIGMDTPAPRAIQTDTTGFRQIGFTARQVDPTVSDPNSHPDDMERASVDTSKPTCLACHHSTLRRSGKHAFSGNVTVSGAGAARLVDSGILLSAHVATTAVGGHLAAQWRAPPLGGAAPRHAQQRQGDGAPVWPAQRTA
jgi:hypothetical protein